MCVKVQLDDSFREIIENCKHSFEILHQLFGQAHDPEGQALFQEDCPQRWGSEVGKNTGQNCKYRQLANPAKCIKISCQNIGPRATHQSYMTTN